MICQMPFLFLCFYFSIVFINSSVNCVFQFIPLEIAEAPESDLPLWSCLNSQQHVKTFLVFLQAFNIIYL